MNKKILFLTLLAVLSLPVIASAQDLGSMAGSVANVALEVGTAIVVIGWVITGILFLTAAGDPGKIGTAKMALFASIAGTIIIIIAKSAENFIGNTFGL